MRKLIREEGNKLSESYWITLASYPKEERLDFIYNPSTYFMDDTFTRDPNNAAYQGDQFDAIIFAAAFKFKFNSLIKYSRAQLRFNCLW